MFFKIGVLKSFAIFTGKHQFLESPLEFSYEYCGIFKNTFFYRTPPAAASEVLSFYLPCRHFADGFVNLNTSRKTPLISSPSSKGL